MASIEKRLRADGSKAYRVSWREDGRQQSETFDYIADARDFRGHVDAAGQRWPTGWIKGEGFDAASSSWTLRAWSHHDITTRPFITDGTRARYLALAERHIWPTLGDLPLDRVTRDRIRVWLTGLDLAPKTVTNVHGLLSSTLSHAVEEGHLGANPCMGMRLPRVDGPGRREAVFLDRDEFATVLAATPDHYRLLLRTMVATGLRWGEVTALQVKHFDGKALHVVQAWKATTDGKLELGPPKSKASRRVVTLTADVADDLAAATRTALPDAWLFTSTRGYPLRNGTFHSRVWIPALDRAQRCDDHRDAAEPCGCVGTLRRRPRIHDLRHTHVAWLMSEGHDIYRIRDRLGHESIQTTERTYGHLLDRDDDDLLASIGSTRLDDAPVPLRKRTRRRA